jgi:hypothetical protein
MPASFQCARTDSSSNPSIKHSPATASQYIELAGGTHRRQSLQARSTIRLTGQKPLSTSSDPLNSDRREERY